jgi:hypothetical protein
MQTASPSAPQPGFRVRAKEDAHARMKIHCLKKTSSQRYAFVCVHTTRSGVTLRASRCSPMAPAMKRAVIGVPS